MQVNRVVLSRGLVILWNAAGLSPVQFNEVALAELEAMGFPTLRCQKALLAIGNNDPAAAMEWLFGHMEDPSSLLLLLFPFTVVLKW